MERAASTRVWIFDLATSRSDEIEAVVRAPTFSRTFGIIRSMGTALDVRFRRPSSGDDDGPVGSKAQIGSVQYLPEVSVGIAKISTVAAPAGLVRCFYQFPT